MKEVTTTDFAKFGYREKRMARELLEAMEDQGLPKDFYDNEVTIMMNFNSGNVFITNSEYQVAMLNGDKLEMFYTCFECGNEGFAEDINWNSDHNCCGECAAAEENEEEQ